MSGTLVDLNASDAAPVDLPAIVTDERSALATVRRLVIAGGAAVSFAIAPWLYLGYVCPDWAWFLATCW